MVTVVQLLLAVVICVLTFLITFAAIQAFYLLHDLRTAAKKLNQLLDKPADFSLRQIIQVTQKMSAPELSKDDRVIANFPPDEVPPASPVSRAPRFFRKSGNPLRG